VQGENARFSKNTRQKQFASKIWMRKESRARGLLRRRLGAAEVGLHSEEVWRSVQDILGISRYVKNTEGDAASTKICMSEVS